MKFWLDYHQRGFNNGYVGVI